MVSFASVSETIWPVWLAEPLEHSVRQMLSLSSTFSSLFVHISRHNKVAPKLLVVPSMFGSSAYHVVLAHYHGNQSNAWRSHSRLDFLQVLEYLPCFTVRSVCRCLPTSQKQQKNCRKLATKSHPGNDTHTCHAQARATPWVQHPDSQAANNFEILICKDSQKGPVTVQDSIWALE